jgi:hypothetical protein
MAITNQEAIRFTNEAVRPLAERFRQLKNDIDSALAAYNSGLGAIFTSGQAEPISDNRENEGVSRLTGNDVLLFVSQLQAFQTQLDGVGVAAVVSKPCVSFING